MEEEKSLNEKIRETIEGFDSLVGYKHGDEHCILPQHYDALSDETLYIVKPEECKTLGSKELKKVFNKTDSFASIAVAIEEKYNCLVVPEEKWDAVTQALLDEVGVLGWKSEWDL